MKIVRLISLTWARLTGACVLDCSFCSKGCKQDCSPRFFSLGEEAFELENTAPANKIAAFAAKPANKIAVLDFSLGKKAFELESTAPANKIAAFAAKPANKIAALDFSLGKEAFELENTAPAN